MSHKDLPTFNYALILLFCIIINSVKNIVIARHSSNLAMNTAIDFQSLMEAERKKMLEEAKIDANQATQEGSQMEEKESVPFFITQDVLDLNDHVVPSEGDVSGIYYIPNFVSEEQANQLLELTYNSSYSAVKWRNLNNRRLQIHGGIPHPSGMHLEELPIFLKEICDAVVRSSIMPADAGPNHVLLNEYTEGQGIRPHKDGPMYESKVCILSLGSPARLDFWGTEEEALHPERSEPKASVMCEHRSLLVFTGDAYENHWHGILAQKQANQDYRRVSYTIRRVKRVLSQDKILYTAEYLAELERIEKHFEDSINDSSF
mmetsp:Transcript_29133/g.38315  ORF Transcript_29133/g.38315 Transcript_29133/m.38315 type:complete len:318 (+) Transcript_29133:141-1094(+)|eukprot:CAMPEP_0117751036 /NCGR_PEP_ID=MMETSP0947-20121206/10729_1 /TAXON_ID=44440 /ORGANISM="Chattonella subsalsa, Strain CCMP2191" /LENGTH=317 /DNA_ID=CAMNT_0005569327 /DNA_START=94 /DNA_END=1047 /DNA_ORIENTATION=-